MEKFSAKQKLYLSSEKVSPEEEREKWITFSMRAKEWLKRGKKEAPRSQKRLIGGFSLFLDGIDYHMICKEEEEVIKK